MEGDAANYRLGVVSVYRVQTLVSPGPPTRLLRTDLVVLARLELLRQSSSIDAGGRQRGQQSKEKVFSPQLVTYSQQMNEPS